MEEPRGGRVRDARMGRLVQQSTPARANRQRTAGGVRNAVPSAADRVSQFGLTQTRKSPGFPGWFSFAPSQVSGKLGEVHEAELRGERLLVDPAARTGIAPPVSQSALIIAGSSPHSA